MKKDKITLKDLNQYIETIRLLSHGRISKSNISSLYSELDGIEKCCSLCRELLNQYLCQ